VKLHPEVAVTVGVNVARSPDEAEMQKQGIDVIAAMFEEEQAAAAAVALEPDSEDEFDDATPPSEAPAAEAPAADEDEDA
jgi:large subunit ribosomal protein L9